MRDEDKTRDDLLAELADLRERFQRLARGEEASGAASREPRLRTLLENSPDVITVLDLEMNVLYLNHTQPGLRLEDTLGKRSTDAMSPDERERFVSAFDAVLSTGLSQQLEVATRTGYV